MSNRGSYNPLELIVRSQRHIYRPQSETKRVCPCWIIIRFGAVYSQVNDRNLEEGKVGWYLDMVAHLRPYYSCFLYVVYPAELLISAK